MTIGPATSNYGTVTLTDSGTVSFAAGDTVSFNNNGYYYGAQIVVGSGGLLQATGTAFNATSGNGTNGGNYTQIYVDSGGHLQASGSTFALGQVYLADGVVFNAGDLVGNGFLLAALHPRHRRPVPLGHRQQQPPVPGHRDPGGHDRQRRDAGPQRHRHPDHGQPPLRLPRRPHRRSGGHRHLRRRVPVLFSGGLTVDQGGSVSIGASASVTIGPATSNYGTVTLTDSGTVSFAARRLGQLQRQRLLLRRADRRRQRRPAPGHRHRLLRHQRQRHQRRQLHPVRRPIRRPAHRDW